MLKTIGAAAALLMTTSFANAAFDAQGVAAQLQSDGYSRIEIKVGQTIAKVEAIKGTAKIEVTYDIASGDVIKTETEQVGADDTAPGVVIGNTDDNDGRGGDDDGPSHDVSDDQGDDGPNDDVNDDHGDDDQSDDDGVTHDANDDQGDDGPNHDVNDDHDGDDHGGKSGPGGDDDNGDDDQGANSGHGGGDDD